MTTNPQAHFVADTAAVVVAFGSLTDYLPPIAAGMSIAYMTFKFCAWVWRATKRWR